MGEENTMTDLEDLFSEIERLHAWEACADPSAIDDLEKRLGDPFPNDLKAFHRRYDVVRLFAGGDGDAPYRFVPVGEIRPTRIDVYGEDNDEWGPGTWLTVCDVQDGNYIAVDIASKDGAYCNYIDCFHETFAMPGQSKIMAWSFTELLDRALHGGAGHFWLQEGFAGHGDGRPLSPENAAIRIGNPEAPRKGWLAEFTFENTWHRKFFGDDAYGGKEKAWEAAQRYIEEHGK
jgi:cell wall assembly regulator SMI1